MYSTYEAGKMRLVNHTRARSPRRAEAVGAAGRTGGTCAGAVRCGAVRRAEMRERFTVESIKNRDNKTLALTGE